MTPPENDSRGLLVVNADDWGRDRTTTDKILECTNVGTVSSVSAMVFMEDSERAAALSREGAIDSGLHLNLTTRPTGKCSQAFLDRQERVGSYLLGHRLAQVVFHPGLIRSFEYLVSAQIDEYRRLYGIDPQRLDGHHHMHLSANVRLQRLMPSGTIVRRNFSFQPGENSLPNRLYRRGVDARLARRHRILDYFFSLPPLSPPRRIERIFDLARRCSVEVETHPVQPDEYQFLTQGSIRECIQGLRFGPASVARR